MPENPIIGRMASLNNDGLIYDFADLKMRAAMNSAGNNIIAWKGDAEPVVSIIPAGVTVTYNGTEYTGTLQPDGSTVQPKSRYLVYRGDPNNRNKYEEYVVVTDPTTEPPTVWWEPMGFRDVNLQDLGDLAFEDTVVLEKGSGANVLGASTNISTSPSAVSFSGGSSDNALGENTTFNVTNPSVSINPTTKHLTASASGTSVGADGTVNALTGLGTPQTETFVKSVTPTKKKLSVRKITPVTGSSSETVATGVNTSKMVKTSVIPCASETESVSKITDVVTGKMVTTTIPNVTGVGTAPTLGMTVVDGLLTLSFNPGSTPTLGDPITAATGALAANGAGATVVNSVSHSSKDVAKKGSSVDVATGALAANGTGDTVATGATTTSINVPTTGTDIDVATGQIEATTTSGTGASLVDDIPSANVVTDSALTGYANSPTSAVLTGVKVNTQPSIALNESDSPSTGSVEFMKSASASASGTAVAAGSNDIVQAVTSVGTATAAAQNVTVGNNDIVKVAAYDALSVQAGDLEDIDDEEL